MFCNATSGSTQAFLRARRGRLSFCTVDEFYRNLVLNSQSLPWTRTMYPVLVRGETLDDGLSRYASGMCAQLHEARALPAELGAEDCLDRFLAVGLD